MYYEEYPSPAGKLYLTGTARALKGLSFSEDVLTGVKEAPPGEFTQVKCWLDDYFRGVPRDPDYVMEPEGTPFRKLIWALLLKVPFGETRTYGELAKEAARIMGKKTMSAQAIGQAVGHNPIAIVIPCHRILGAGGKLTGYAYGVGRKQWLLDHEQK